MLLGVVQNMSRPAVQQGYQQNPNMYKPRNGPPQQFPHNGQPNMYHQPPAMNGYGMPNGNASHPNSMPPARPQMKVKLKRNMHHFAAPNQLPMFFLFLIVNDNFLSKDKYIYCACNFKDTLCTKTYQQTTDDETKIILLVKL